MASTLWSHRLMMPTLGFLSGTSPGRSFKSAGGKFAMGPSSAMSCGAGVEGRLDTTNNNTDWTKTRQGLTSLVHDTWLTNGRRAKLRTTLPACSAGSAWGALC